MKKIKLIVLTAITLFCFTGSFAQTPTSEVVVVRVYEDLFTSNQILISYGGGKTEVIDMGKRDKKIMNWAKYMKNIEKINEVLSRFMKEGYVITSSTAGSMDNVLVNTYIFTKKENK